MPLGPTAVKGGHPPGFHVKHPLGWHLLFVSCTHQVCKNETFFETTPFSDNPHGRSAWQGVGFDCVLYQAYNVSVMAPCER
jgi:hypothetical protein